MTIIHAFILSIVEGITEFLPISSTAHLTLTSQLLGINQTDFVKSFEIIIQLGAILAVGVLYFKELTRSLKLWFSITIAFLPTALSGFLLYPLVKNVLIGNSYIASIALILGGIAFIGYELSKRDAFLSTLIKKVIRSTNTSKASKSSSHSWYGYDNGNDNNSSGNRNNSESDYIGNGKNTEVRIDNISYNKLLLIGCVQSISMIPGVSRSAASIAGGMICGLSRKDAAKFSFMLAIPTMLSASLYDIYKTGLSLSQDQISLIAVGFIGSFIFALLTVKTFIKYVQLHSFITFGIYRIIVGTLWLSAILFL